MRENDDEGAAILRKNLDEGRSESCSRNGVRLVMRVIGIAKQSLIRVRNERIRKKKDR